MSKRNPVAKNMELFNRPATYKNRQKEVKKGYRKHAKDWRDSSKAAA